MRKILLILFLVAIAAGIGIFALSKNDGVVVREGERGSVEEEGAFVITLFEDAEVGGLLHSFNPEEKTKTFSGVDFTLTPSPNPVPAGRETTLSYNLRIGGEPASDMQTQDGVYGKGVAVHRETRELVPVEIIRKATPHGTLEFRAVFPTSGEYIIFNQFKREGEIITTHFAVPVI